MKNGLSFFLYSQDNFKPFNLTNIVSSTHDAVSVALQGNSRVDILSSVASDVKLDKNAFRKSITWLSQH